MKPFIPALLLACAAHVQADTANVPQESDRTQGDTLKIYVSEQAPENAKPLPGRGLSTADVRQNFGEPTSVQSAPGTPPISVWRYGEFTVYFERDSVIHAVRHHKPGE